VIAAADPIGAAMFNYDKHGELHAGTRYQSMLYNPAFLREKGLPVPAWLE
jgi:hypothetical protein